jgi:DNA-binding IclR family transcriptional regulator
MKVLQAFAHNRRELRLSEISDITGLDRSAAQRFVYSLHVLGYLTQDPRSKLFRLSPKTLELGFSYLSSDPLVEFAMPVLQKCSQDTGETVNVSELYDTDIVIVGRVPGTHAVNINVSIGSNFPAFCTAPGRAILAFLPNEVADDIVLRSKRERMTEHTIIGIPHIKQELKATREQGFCIATQEVYLGEISVAAPVFDMHSKPIGAVNIPVPTARWNLKDARKTLAPTVSKHADQITKQIGGRKPN